MVKFKTYFYTPSEETPTIATGREQVSYYKQKKASLEEQTTKGGNVEHTKGQQHTSQSKGNQTHTEIKCR